MCFEKYDHKISTLYTMNNNSIEINLSRKQLEEIPRNISIENLNNIESLYLSCNQLKGLNQDTLRHLIKLKILKLDNNKIENLNWFPNNGGGLINLNKIYLSHNKIKQINLNIFVGLEQLNLIDLSHNEIEKIDIKEVKSLKKLKSIDLSFNKIESFDLILFDEIMMQEIDLSNNDSIKLKLAGFNFIQNVNAIKLDKMRAIIEENLKVICPSKIVREQLIEYKVIYCLIKEFLLICFQYLFIESI